MGEPLEIVVNGVSIRRRGSLLEITIGVEELKRTIEDLIREFSQDNLMRLEDYTGFSAQEYRNAVRELQRLPEIRMYGGIDLGRYFVYAQIDEAIIILEYGLNKEETYYRRAWLIEEGKVNGFVIEENIVEIRRVDLEDIGPDNVAQVVKVRKNTFNREGIMRRAGALFNIAVLWVGIRDHVHNSVSSYLSQRLHSYAGKVPDLVRHTLLPIQTLYRWLTSDDEFVDVSKNETIELAGFDTPPHILENYLIFEGKQYPLKAKLTFT